MTDDRPALLVSYIYLKQFLQYRARYDARDWVLDSGAFSAFHSDMTIDLDEYTATCRDLLATDPTLTEVFALDVIGDHDAGLRNCERMWRDGVPAIPCYHHGEPESVLLELARCYPKIAIALGTAAGVVTGSKKLRWAEQCFARVWPKRIHGFAFGSEPNILALPWHSVDATNWESGPCRWGNWLAYGRMSVKGSTQNLRVEVERVLTIEAKARVRWRREMEILDAPDAPSIRLAVATVRETQVQRFTGVRS